MSGLTTSGLTAADVARITGGTLLAPPATPITGVATADSRQVGPGDLYVAIVGQRADGHDFAAAAYGAGAALVLSSRPVAGPCVVVGDVLRALGEVAREHLRRLKRHGGPTVVAVTGSVGKTTTKDLMSALLATLGTVVAPPGSLNNELGLPLTVLRAGPHTRFLVTEMGADKAGDLTYLTSIARPDVAVELVVGRAHLGGFGSMDAVARAKAELVEALEPGAVAVLNADDGRVAAMAGKTRAQVQWFSVVGPGQVPAHAGRHDVWAQGMRVDQAGHPEFTLHWGPGDGGVVVRSALVGAHHVTNLLAASSVALRLGARPDAVAEVLAGAAAASPHRMAVTVRADGVTVVDDTYNANPDSMRAGIDALARLAAGAGGRSIAVLGTMLELGGASEAEHHELGEYLADAGIDMVLGVGHGGAQIVAGAAARGTQHRWVVDGPAALAWLAGNLRSGDTVLIKASHSAHLEVVAESLVQPGGQGVKD